MTTAAPWSHRHPATPAIACCVVADALLSARSAAAAVAKSAIRRFPGKLPAYRSRLVVRRATELPGLARFEVAEARRAVAAWGGRPSAGVAVIVPTYRRAAPLVAAVESALAQTVADLVVVVIDDGAGLPPLPPDPRVRAYSLTRNCGVAGVVRNVGIRASSSRYLAFLDDDNVWMAGHLETAIAVHEAGAELTYSALERVRPDGTVKDVLSVPFHRATLRETAISDTNTIVVRRGPGVRFSRVRVRQGEFPLEDWELVYRLSRRLRTEHVARATARYLIHEGSFFTDWDAAEAEAARRAG